MINKYVKLTLELLGLQIFFSILAMFFMPFFSWMDKWEIIFSVITSWLFLGAVHSTFWQLGRKDKKNNTIVNNHISDNESKVKLSLFGGAKFGSVTFAFNLAIIFIAANLPEGNVSDILYNIHRMLIGPMFGFLPQYSDSSYWLFSAILCFVIYITCIVAYISGVYNFSISEKLVPKILYKTNNK